MASTARRALVLVLVLSLALTACGRSGTRVTADDGRGIDRPGGGIWIPETRGVDVVEEDPTLEAEDEDDSDDDTEPADGDPDGAARVSAPADTEPDEPEALEPPSPRRPAGEAGTPAPTPAPSSGAPADDGDADQQDEQADAPAEQDPQDEDDEPAEPEVVGDCGVAGSEPPARDELEEEVARLRVLIAERWPDTQAGAWILADEDRLTVHVGFTRSVRSSLRAACEEFGYPQLLHGVRTELSEAELQEHLEVVLAERDALREGQPPEDLPREIRRTRGRYAAHVDHAANGLLVTVEEPTERLRDAFRERYTPRLLLAEGSVDEDGELVVDEDE
jgi:hypothetical protein